MAFLFEDLNTRIEPLISIVFVVSHAGTEDVHQRKALVLDGAFKDFHHVLLFTAKGARDVGRTADDRHWNRIDRIFHAAVGC